MLSKFYLRIRPVCLSKSLNSLSIFPLSASSYSAAASCTHAFSSQQRLNGDKRNMINISRNSASTRVAPSDYPFPTDGRSKALYRRAYEDLTHLCKTGARDAEANMKQTNETPAPASVLLLCVSGGVDSMAMLHLIAGAVHLHTSSNAFDRTNTVHAHAHAMTDTDDDDVTAREVYSSSSNSSRHRPRLGSVLGTAPELHVVHFDHKLRPESTLEARFVEAWCDRYGIPFHGRVRGNEEGEGECQGHSQAQGQRNWNQSKGIPAAAREWRRKESSDLLRSLCTGTGTREDKVQEEGKWERPQVVNRAAGYIATAHHQGDQLEEIVLRLLRGVHISRLHGMQARERESGMHAIESSSVREEKKEGVAFIKPLLSWTKDELQQAVHTLAQNPPPFLATDTATDAHLPLWYEDSSNQSTQYRRNAIRLDVLPLLAQHAGGDIALRNRLICLSEQSLELRTWIQKEATLFLLGSEGKGKKTARKQGLRRLRRRGIVYGSDVFPSSYILAGTSTVEKSMAHTRQTWAMWGRGNLFCELSVEDGQGWGRELFFKSLPPPAQGEALRMLINQLHSPEEETEEDGEGAQTYYLHIKRLRQLCNAPLPSGCRQKIVHVKTGWEALRIGKIVRLQRQGLGHGQGQGQEQIDRDIEVSIEGAGKGIKERGAGTRLYSRLPPHILPHAALLPFCSTPTSNLAHSPSLCLSLTLSLATGTPPPFCSPWQWASSQLKLNFSLPETEIYRDRRFLLRFPLPGDVFTRRCSGSGSCRGEGKVVSLTRYLASLEVAVQHRDTCCVLVDADTDMQMSDTNKGRWQKGNGKVRAVLVGGQWMS